MVKHARKTVISLGAVALLTLAAAAAPAQATSATDIPKDRCKRGNYCIYDPPRYPLWQYSGNNDVTHTFDGGSSWIRNNGYRQAGADHIRFTYNYFGESKKTGCLHPPGDGTTIKKFTKKKSVNIFKVRWVGAC
ncbi:hypothetical protein E1295_25705 [Nonomuraea mesophila]|uniref:Peptidase inhibitor family I36 protein n=1 Tax=Nonomuraea mesophila TaxID=2530382 RepID=A0A4R5F7Q2_9ACTN|nr:hypothetical protein [Nonomuraea mesophila]TDE44009.1 hypothetical protein E1295_25705 [Nonomuraea mesophila]